MNAVEIEEAISALAERPFDAGEFPYAFLEAFGNKETTIKRLRKGESNKSDLGGVLQTNDIHIATCEPGEVTRTLAALKASPATVRAKARLPATITVHYDPDAIPVNLRAAQERNDELLGRIYIGRRFENDTERLEKLFELYTKMTTAKANAKGVA